MPLEYGIQAFIGDSPARDLRSNRFFCKPKASPCKSVARPAPLWPLSLLRKNGVTCDGRRGTPFCWTQKRLHKYKPIL